jgi:hypothetical protein
MIRSLPSHPLLSEGGEILRQAQNGFIGKPGTQIDDGRFVAVFPAAEAKASKYFRRDQVGSWLNTKIGGLDFRVIHQFRTGTG